MAKHTIPHLDYLFQELGIKFQEIKLSLLQTSLIQTKITDLWEEILDEIQEPSESVEPFESEDDQG